MMFKKILKSYDYSLVIAITLLSLFSLIMVYSASMATAVARYGVASDYFYQKQKLFIICGAFFFVITSLFPYKALKSKKILMTIVFSSVLVLIAVFLFGHVAGNAQNWFKIGPISIQPAEFVKLCVIVYLSAMYDKKQEYINQFNKGVVPPFLFRNSLFINSHSTRFWYS